MTDALIGMAAAFIAIGAIGGWIVIAILAVEAWKTFKKGLKR